jgi:outer membrane lipopolysaccharide assembly protein LptE/RlpB
MKLVRKQAGRRLLSLSALGVVVLSLVGCGYALVGRGSNLPTDVRKVYVSPMENRTARSQVEQILTRAVVDELITRQRFEVLTNATGADAEIRGAVVGYAATPVVFNPDGRATSYEISFIAQVLFQRMPTNPDEKPAVLWRNDRYQFRETYDLPGDAVDYFDQEDEAIEEVAKRFAETMVSDLLEGF